MRILTVRQPWAWAIIHGGKNVENRSRNIAGQYRGSVAIHVAGKYAEDGLDLPTLDEACAGWCEANAPCAEKQHPWQANVGHIIGVVDLVDVHKSEYCFAGEEYLETGAITFCSPWGDSSAVHLVLRNPRPLSEPIPYKGALGLREVPADLLARIEAAL